MVPASSPHPPKTEYKVAIGTELWGNDAASVIKVQMVYSGKVEGRKSPSYPLGTDDMQRVIAAMVQLITDND